MAFYQQGGLTLLRGDAPETLQAMPSGSVHTIVTDPAYESLNKWRGIGTTTRLGGAS